MKKITRIIFDLVPNPEGGQYFLDPHAYIFRGVLMGWLDQFKHDLGDKLHMKQPKNTPLYYGNYTLHQQYLYLGREGWTTESPRIPRTKDNSSARTYANHEGPQGLRYFLTLFDTDLSTKFFELLMQRQENAIQFGPQQALISSIKIETMDMDTWILQTRPVQRVTINFASPTSFNQMGTKNELRIPLPEYFFSYLYKFWNHLHEETPLQIEKSFYDWVKTYVTISSYDLKTKGWEMGKEKKMVGAVGWVTYSITGKHEKYARWMDVLLKLAEYSGVGNNRSAGFGRVWKDDAKYGSDLILNVAEMPTPDIVEENHVENLTNENENTPIK